MNEPATYANNLPLGRPFIIAEHASIAASATNSAIILKNNTGGVMVVEKIVGLMDLKPWNTLALCDLEIARVEFTDEVTASTMALNFGSAAFAVFFGPDGVIEAMKFSQSLTMRPGSELTFSVNNLDTQNAVRVDLAAHGFLMDRVTRP
jgi:hypothetical protein